jgi:acetolactate synthase-1/2/3 large subunit
VPTLFKAWEIAHSDEPGPVFVEIPVNLQMFPGEVGELPPAPVIARPQRAAAADFPARRRNAAGGEEPGLFIGWGARDADDQTRAIAEFCRRRWRPRCKAFRCSRPTTRCTPASASAPPPCPPRATPLPIATACWRSAPASPRSPPAASASRCRPGLMHVDINPQVFNANYPAAVTLEGDAVPCWRTAGRTAKVGAGAHGECRTPRPHPRDKAPTTRRMAAPRQRRKVNPAVFFNALRAAVPDDAIAVVDDGNHTYLTAELFPVHGSRRPDRPDRFQQHGLRGALPPSAPSWPIRNARCSPSSATAPSP